MELTHDATLNVAYLSLRSKDDEVVGRVRSVTLLDTAANEDIVLDLDEDGRLLGIEFLDARRALTPSILRDATTIG